MPEEKDYYGELLSALNAGDKEAPPPATVGPLASSKEKDYYGELSSAMAQAPIVEDKKSWIKTLPESIVKNS
jgi:hypothetical protein